MGAQPNVALGSVAHYAGPPMSETDVIAQERLKAANRGAWALRNNSGAFKDETGRLVRYGLGNDSKRINGVFKSADLIVIEPVIITADMIGQVIGQFVGIECKKRGWKYTGTDREIAQKRFLDKLIELGGRGYFSDGETLTDSSVIP
jgi:hypothetical protein